jgi:hypothetical protein
MKYYGPNNLDKLIETENVESILEEIDVIWSALDGQEKDISNDFPQIYATLESEVDSIEPASTPIEEKAALIEPLTKHSIEKLKLEAESPKKRLKYSNVPIEYTTVEPELIPVKPLTTYFHEKVKKHRRQRPFCQNMTEPNRNEQDIDDKVLLRIDFLRYQHKAITNTNILFNLGVSDSDLAASKNRLINNGYIKGDKAVFWHSFTKKAKSRVEQLQSDEAASKSKTKHLQKKN